MMKALGATLQPYHFQWTRLCALMAAVTLASCGQTPATDHQLPSIPRHAITQDGQTISYKQTGAPQGRPVIFVHGTPGNADGWDEYLLTVPAGRLYIAIDRPGFGESSPAEAVVSLGDQARSIEELSKRLKLPPAILVGHSLGGPIVAQAASDFPHRAAALVVLAGSLDPAMENVPFVQHVGDTWPIRVLLPRPMRNANREIIALEQELIKLRPKLSQLSLPVVVLHGTLDQLVPFDNVAYIKSQFIRSKNLEIIVLRGQNHFLPWNSKPEVDKAITRALELSRVVP